MGGPGDREKDAGWFPTSCWGAPSPKGGASPRGKTPSQIYRRAGGRKSAGERGLCAPAKVHEGVLRVVGGLLSTAR